MSSESRRLMSAEMEEKLGSVRGRHYTPEAEPDVLRLLQAAFRNTWGDSAFWRWKHCTRPGFSPTDVLIYTSGEAAIGCWHMARYALLLAPRLEVLCSFEGDYAVDAGWRGIGIRRSDPATLEEMRGMAERGIVARFAFTSQTLYERLYQRKLGWQQVPTVTAGYRKLLSDRAIRSRLEAAGAHLLQGHFVRRLVRTRPLVIQVEVCGFAACTLVIQSDGAACREGLEPDPDLLVRIPYAALTITRPRPALAFLLLVRAFLCGQIRTRGLTRFAARCLSPRPSGN
jgi:hypothetical protein